MAVFYNIRDTMQTWKQLWRLWRLWASPVMRRVQRSPQDLLTVSDRSLRDSPRGIKSKR